MIRAVQFSTSKIVMRLRRCNNGLNEQGIKSRLKVSPPIVARSKNENSFDYFLKHIVMRWRSEKSSIFAEKKMNGWRGAAIIILRFLIHFQTRIVRRVFFHVWTVNTGLRPNTSYARFCEPCKTARSFHSLIGRTAVRGCCAAIGRTRTPFLSIRLRVNWLFYCFRQ
jgi:hypothetical protein